jgi:hypothetical protein
VFIYSDCQYVVLSTGLNTVFRYGLSNQAKYYGNYGAQNYQSDYGSIFGVRIVRPSKVTTTSIIHNYVDGQFALKEHTIFTTITGESVFNAANDQSRYLFWNDREHLGIYIDLSSPLGRIFGNVSIVNPSLISNSDGWINVVPYGASDDRIIVNAAKNKVFHTTNMYSILRTFGTSFDPLQDPRSAAIDALGGIYIADSGNNRIKYYDEQGKLRKVWGSYGDGPGQFDYPHGVAVGPDGLVSESS